MKAVMLEVDQRLVGDRRRLGLDVNPEGPVRLEPDSAGVAWPRCSTPGFATVGEVVRIAGDGGRADAAPG